MSAAQYVLSIKDVNDSDKELAGEYAIRLGILNRAKISTPDAFVITTKAFDLFIEQNELKKRLDALMLAIHTHDHEVCEATAKKIISLFSATPLPDVIEQAVMKAYVKMGGVFNQATVGIRADVMGSIPGVHLSGIHTLFIDVQGETNVLDVLRKAWAVAFESKVLMALAKRPQDWEQIHVAVTVQVCLAAEISGSMLTMDPISREKNALVIEAVRGEDSPLVMMSEVPDHYVYNKFTRSLVRKEISAQKRQLIRKGKELVWENVPKAKLEQPKLSDEQITELAELGKKIEQLFLAPQTVLWFRLKNRWYVSGTKTMTHLQDQPGDIQDQTRLAVATSQLKLLSVGIPGSNGLVSGTARIVKSIKDYKMVKKGDVLVVSYLDLKHHALLRFVRAVITKEGGQTSQLALWCRELGIPSVFGCDDVFSSIKNGDVITVDGGSGRVYAGRIQPGKKVVEPVEEVTEKIVATEPVVTATRVFCNLATAEAVEGVAMMAVDGVGLLQLDSIVTDYGMHPKELADRQLTMAIEHRLTDAIVRVCEAFDSRPVLYRLTNLLTHHYKELKGGRHIEASEQNPLLGYHGTLRHLYDQRLLIIELEVIKYIRSKVGLRNLQLVTPVLRTVEELVEFKRVLAGFGLMRGASFKLHMNVATPASAILAEEFEKVGIDGFVVDYDWLEKLSWGLDTENADLMVLVSKQRLSHPPLHLIHHLVSSGCKNGQTVVVSVATPENELVEGLICAGVSAISVDPSFVPAARHVVAGAENRYIRKK